MMTDMAVESGALLDEEGVDLLTFGLYFFFSLY